MAEKFNPYHVLGVSSTATMEEITAAFYQKGRLVHPDKNPDPQARTEFEKLCRARDALRDERAKWDRKIQRRLNQESHRGRTSQPYPKKKPSKARYEREQKFQAELKHFRELLAEEERNRQKRTDSLQEELAKLKQAREQEAKEREAEEQRRKEEHERQKLEEEKRREKEKEEESQRASSSRHFPPHGGPPFPFGGQSPYFPSTGFESFVPPVPAAFDRAPPHVRSWHHHATPLDHERGPTWLKERTSPSFHGRVNETTSFSIPPYHPPTGFVSHVHHELERELCERKRAVQRQIRELEDELAVINANLEEVQRFTSFPRSN